MEGKGSFLVLVILVFCLTGKAYCYGHPDFQSDYQSPYKVTLSIPMSELMAPDNIPPRGNFKLESDTPFERWYSDGTLRKYQAWGPQSRHYPPVDGYATRSSEWKRQRLLAVACSMIGLPYQHHHIPDWNPPPDWPWKEVAYGRNSKGMDCSDFTSWLYNYGLGLKLKTGIRQQALALTEADADDTQITIVKIHDDGGYNSLVSKLIAGDLLYIKHKDDGEISHVIMWLGKYGQSPDGTPLVIDCTGPEHIDSSGNHIPIGVQIRPFGRDSWYYKSFSHANRIIADN
jgi:cell wall-associated NlpC family hydrolase